MECPHDSGHDTVTKEFFKLRFGREEIGWARRINDKLAIIENVPMVEGLNYGDVVIVEEGTDGVPEAGQVISRKFPNAVYIWYDTDDQYHFLTDILTMLGCETEGYFSASEKDRGLMKVNYRDGFFPLKIAEGLGIKNPEENKSEEKE